MNTFKLLLPLIGIMFSISAFAADIVCKGRVVSADDLEPFIGVTIKVENTNSWVCSDLNGNFTITAPEGSNLVFMYVGCESQTVKAKQNLGTITLQSSPMVHDDRPAPTQEEVKRWVDEGLKLYDEKKFEEAFRKFDDAAFENSARGEYLVGLCYRDGIGTRKDEKLFVAYMSSATDQGYSPALYFFGIMYRDGDGVPKNLKLAEQYLRKAADKGYDDAKIALFDLTSGK